MKRNIDMNLISCKGCGIVLDKDVLCFYIRESEHGSIDKRTAGYSQVLGEWAAKVACPACQEDIFEGE